MENLKENLNYSDDIPNLEKESYADSIQSATDQISSKVISTILDDGYQNHQVQMQILYKALQFERLEKPRDFDQKPDYLQHQIQNIINIQNMDLLDSRYYGNSALLKDDLIRDIFSRYDDYKKLLRLSSNNELDLTHRILDFWNRCTNTDNYTDDYEITWARLHARYLIESNKTWIRPMKDEKSEKTPEKNEPYKREVPIKGDEEEDTHNKSEDIETENDEVNDNQDREKKSDEELDRNIKEKDDIKISDNIQNEIENDDEENKNRDIETSEEENEIKDINEKLEDDNLTELEEKAESRDLEYKSEAINNIQKNEKEMENESNIIRPNEIRCRLGHILENGDFVRWENNKNHPNIEDWEILNIDWDSKFISLKPIKIFPGIRDIEISIEHFLGQNIYKLDPITKEPLNPAVETMENIIGNIEQDKKEIDEELDSESLLDEKELDKDTEIRSNDFFDVLNEEEIEDSFIDKKLDKKKEGLLYKIGNFFKNIKNNFFGFFRKRRKQRLDNKYNQLKIENENLKQNLEQLKKENKLLIKDSKILFKENNRLIQLLEKK